MAPLWSPVTRGKAMHTVFAVGQRVTRSYDRFDVGTVEAVSEFNGSTIYAVRTDSDGAIWQGSESAWVAVYAGMFGDTVHVQPRHPRHVPAFTANLLGMLQLASVPAELRDMAGGAWAIMANLATGEGDAEDCILISDRDANLPDDSSPILVTRYGYDESGDVVEHAPILETDVPQTLTTVADLVITHYHALRDAQTVMVTLTRSEAEYLSILADIDDDPTNAIDCGFSQSTWESARAAIVKAARA